MLKTLHKLSRWSRPPTTLSAASSLRMEVVPPSLRCAPAASESAWQRLMFWLMAPAPQQALPLSRLPQARTEFLATLADIDNTSAERLRERINDARSLRELWHVRAEIYRVVGLAHTQDQAEQRVALLNRYFPTRAPRSQFAFS
jgi:hypothetical protein